MAYGEIDKIVVKPLVAVSSSVVCNNNWFTIIVSLILLLIVVFKVYLFFKKYKINIVRREK